MKKFKTIRILLSALVFVSIAAFSNAQGIVGSWKKKDEVITKESGKATSTFKMLVKNMPCFANIVYTFSAGGKMDEQAKDCSTPLQKQITAGLKTARWKVAGDKLIIDDPDKAALVKHAEYHLTFTGPNEMVWTFIYAENPGVPNITRAKQMQTTYVKF